MLHTNIFLFDFTLLLYKYYVIAVALNILSTGNIVVYTCTVRLCT
jgi:hypothetical protein